MLRFLFIMAPLLAATLAQEAVHDLDTNLTAWNRLIRDAGYYTESGIWLGGLWRVASVTENEKYSCLSSANATNDYCAVWSLSERTRKKKEDGQCHCSHADGDAGYCERWECETTHVDKNARCTSTGEATVCRDLVLKDRLRCGCANSSQNGRYCSAWNCRETSSKGSYEDEDYVCLVEDVSAEYCYRWKGAISSSHEIESSVCECFERGEAFCMEWRCRERGIIRCAAHVGGWCHIELAVLLGGGMGLLCFLPSLCHYLECGACSARVSVFCCRWVGISELRYGTPAYFAAELRTLITAFATLCLPWLIGVLIWGGTPALCIVLPIWLCVLFEAARRRYDVYRRDSRDVRAISSQMAVV